MTRILWRETARNPVFFNLDGVVMLPFLLLMLHWAAWTLYLSVFTTISLWVVSLFGVSAIAAVRFLKVQLSQIMFGGYLWVDRVNSLSKYKVF